MDFLRDSRTVFYVKVGGSLVLVGAAMYAMIRALQSRRTGATPALSDKDAAGPVLNQYERQLEQDFVCKDRIDVDFSDIGGLEGQIQEIEDLVLLPLSHGHLFQHSRVAQKPTGVLLYGPPGTGKTLMAKAIAKRAAANFFTVNVASVESKWFGETPKIVEAMFSLARKRAPCVIFIDEVDGLLSTRSDSEMSHVTTMKTKFMEMWDGLGTSSAAVATAGSTTSSSSNSSSGNAAAPSSDWVIVIGATNKPWALDPAVLRRMPRQIFVGLPDAEARASILRVMLKHERVEESLSLEGLMEATEGYSGSDLRELVRAATLIPIREAFHRERKSKGSKSSGAAATAGNANSSTAPSMPRLMNTDDLIMALETVKPTGATARAYKITQMRTNAPNAFSSNSASASAASGSSFSAAAAAVEEGALKTPVEAKGSSIGNDAVDSAASATAASRSMPVLATAVDSPEQVVRAILEFGPSLKRNSVSVCNAVESAAKSAPPQFKLAAAIAGGENVAPSAADVSVDGI